MMRMLARATTIVAALALVLATPATAALNVNLDFLWNPDPDNETQVYLHVANTAWAPPRDQVRAVYPRMKAPETDYPVLLFIASEARVSLVAVWDLRSKGLPWAQVMVKLGVPPERIFVEMPRDPGPPYGKAYGHWKNHQKGEVVVTDDDVFYWTNIRSMARYFHVEPATVVEWRGSGRTWKTVAAGEYRLHKEKEKGRKTDKAGGAGKDDQGEDRPGHSKGKGKGH